MAALDEQEAEANAGGPVTALEAAEVVAYLRDLARLWDDAPLSRRALARLSSSGSRSWDCAGCGSSRRRQRSPRAS